MHLPMLEGAENEYKDVSRRLHGFEVLMISLMAMITFVAKDWPILVDVLNCPWSPI